MSSLEASAAGFASSAASPPPGAATGSVVAVCSLAAGAATSGMVAVVSAIVEMTVSEYAIDKDLMLIAATKDRIAMGVVPGQQQ